MSPTKETAEPKRDMKVLALGLPRTGSASIAEALTILGYKNVYHGVKAIDNPEDWKIIGRACDASYPNLPSYTGKPFTREQWDELYGACEATTDVASVFSPQLIEVYPEAKVLLVIRDFDKWEPSINTVFDQLWNPMSNFIMNYVEPLLGSETGISARKTVLGYFQAQNKEECQKNTRETYDRHHRVIRQMVAPDNLLEYRMGDGWKPLCEFLDKPVPDVEFPWVNEAAALKATVKKKMARQFTEAFMVVLPWAVGVGAIGAAAAYMAMKRV